MCKRRLVLIIHRIERSGRRPTCTLFIWLFIWLITFSMRVKAVYGLVLIELLTSGNETLVRVALSASPVPQLPDFFAF